MKRMKKMISFLLAIIILSACNKTVYAELPEGFIQGFSGNSYKIETIKRFIQSINHLDRKTYLSYLSAKINAAEIPMVKIESANFRLVSSDDITDSALLQLITDDHKTLLYWFDEVVIERELAPIPVFTPVELKEPDYIEEGQYVGNERDVVRLLNLFMKFTNLHDDQSRLNILKGNNSLNPDYLWPIILGMKIHDFEFKDNEQTAIVHTTMELDREGNSNSMFVLMKVNKEWKIAMVD